VFLSVIILSFPDTNPSGHKQIVSVLAHIPTTPDIIENKKKTRKLKAQKNVTARHSEQSEESDFN